jgi:hypothetical protein
MLIKRLLCILFIMAFVMSWFGSASAYTIDFENEPNSVYWSVGEFIDVGDYRFTISEKYSDSQWSENLGFLSVEHWEEPTSSFLQSYFLREYTMTRIDGNLFNLYSLDFGVLVIGHPLFHEKIKVSSDSLSMTCEVPKATFWDTFDFGTIFFNVDKIIFRPIFDVNADGAIFRYSQVDNLVVTSPSDPVPIPSTILLLGIGLIILIKKTVW